MAKKHTSFQLKPSHLVYSVLGICVVAIATLIIGVVGTFNPRDQVRQEEEQVQKQVPNTTRVEVWQPDNDHLQNSIVINPDAVNQPRRSQTAAARPAADTDSDSTGNTENSSFSAAPADNGRNEVRRQSRTEQRDSGQPAESSRAKPLPTVEQAGEQAAKELNRATEAVKPEPKPEPRPEPKPEPKPESPPEPRPEPRPEPKPEPKPPAKKDVIDNLF